VTKHSNVTRDAQSGKSSSLMTECWRFWITMQWNCYELFTRKIFGFWHSL